MTQKNLLLIAISLVAGIIISWTFKTCNKETSADDFIIPPSVIKKQAAQMDQHYTVIIDSLQKQSDVLQLSLVDTKKSLEQVKLKNTQLRKAALSYATNEKTDLQEDHVQVDSLKQTVIQWSQTDHQKDSLYESVINTQSSQLLLKDSVIGIQELQHQSLQVYFQQSLLQQELLMNQNKQIQKKLKRQTLKSKILGGLALIATGISTYQALR
jgi:hypothetical protein